MTPSKTALGSLGTCSKAVGVEQALLHMPVDETMSNRCARRITEPRGKPRASAQSLAACRSSVGSRADNARQPYP